jgi:hypothetical protein
MMPSQHQADVSAEQATGTKDEIYNLVSALYHALQGAEAAGQYMQDAEQTNDQELVQFFREAQDWHRHLASQARAVLKQRLKASDGRYWNPEAKIWNLKLMA